MALIKNYKKAVRATVFAERTQTLTITYKEYFEGEIITHKEHLKAWEVLNILDAINPLAFISLKTAI